MSVTVECAQCGKKLTAPDDLRGKRAKCSCGAVIEIPAAVPEDSAAADEPAAAPAEQPAEPKPVPPRTLSASEGGRRRVSERYKKRKGSPAMTYIGIGGAIAGVVVLVVALISGGGPTESEEPETTVSGQGTQGDEVPAVGEAATEGEKPQEQDKPADEPLPEDKEPEPEEALEPDEEPPDVPKEPPPLKEQRPVEDFFDR